MQERAFMPEMKTIKLTTGMYWVEVPKADLFLLCGCPADSVKHLLKTGLISVVNKDNHCYETGPNAILLSDVLMQNGDFCNLGEFPVLQMLYRQGMILPGHVNNTGIKPLIIGTKEQVDAQLQYIFRGNYGLINQDEIIQTGIGLEMAREMMRIKLKFAFGRIRPTEELLDSLIVEKSPIEIRNGVTIEYLGRNQYKLCYEDESTVVDLNLKPHEFYRPPYTLSLHQVRREYFSVIHSGEGDGWDTERPCMASVITFQGKIFLIDAGPHIEHTLTALGIDVSEIDGIFHTHGHDDHFAGLPSLMRADHRIKYFSTPLIRSSVAKKLAALTSIQEEKFYQYFDVHDLRMNEWNNVEGLEVRPFVSPHPVETNCFTFRALSEEGYKSYTHMADVVALNVLKGMVTEDPEAPGCSMKYYDSIKKEYMQPANIKKIDIGGGLIHGEASDFTHDRSDKILLAHTARALTKNEKEVGSEAPFGIIDVLIPGHQDYAMQRAARYLQTYFPEVPMYELRILLNCQLLTFNAGSILIKRGVQTDNVYLVLTGTVEIINKEHGIVQKLSTGSLIGDYSTVMETPPQETYRARSYIQTLRFPAKLYRSFIERNDLYMNVEIVRKRLEFLQTTWLFGDGVSYLVQNRIAQNMTMRILTAKQILETQEDQGLFILEKGELQLLSGEKVNETLKGGDFFCEEVLLFNLPGFFQVKVTQPSRVYFIESRHLDAIPIVYWKLLEVSAKRMSGYVEGLSRVV